MTVVSISGPSGSGKSSLVQALCERLPRAKSLHFDDYKEAFPEDLALWVRQGALGAVIVSEEERTHASMQARAGTRTGNAAS